MDYFISTMYTWQKKGKLITIDIYTCKFFDPLVAVNFTKLFFDLVKIEFNDNTDLYER